MFERVRGTNENAGASIVRQDRAGRLRFEHAGGGCSNGKDALGGVDGISGIGADRVHLLVHRVRTDVFGFHWQKGPGADMEGDEGVRDRGEDFGSEVKAGRWGCYGAGGLGIDGLVSFVIGFVRSAFEVGREGHVTMFFEVRRGRKLDDPLALGKNVQNLGDCSGDGNTDALLEFAPRSGQAFPFGVAQGLEKEDLDGGRF